MSGPVDKPAAELDLDADLVRGLLREQHPDLADRPIRELASGWDNALFRIGDDLIARLPRRELGAGLVDHEVRWLPELAPRLPLPIPAPVHVGEPSASYPWRWTLVPYLPGEPALHAPPDDLDRAALALAGFLRALHLPAPADAPVNPFRGVPLRDRDERTREWIAELSGDLDDAPAVEAAWEAAVAVPGWAGPPCWLHGDLHPHNVIVDGGRISGIIDFGDLTSGDPATDLLLAWMLLPAGPRARLRDALAIDDDTWARGRGWALSIGLAYLFHSAEDPAYGRCGRGAIAAVVEDRQ